MNEIMIDLQGGAKAPLYEKIYEYIKNGCNNEKVLKLKQEGREECIKLFEEYKKGNKQIY